MKKNYWKNEKRFRDYNHHIVEFFSKQRLKEIEKYISVEKGMTMLDIGAGNGFSSYYYENELLINVVAGDFSIDMLKRNPIEKKIIFDAQRIPFKDNEFDIVNIWEVLHHIKTPEIVIKEAYRVSKKYIIVFEPNRYNLFQFLFALVDNEHRFVLNYSIDYLKSMVEKAGFKILCAKKVGLLFPNLTPEIFFKIIKILPFSNIFGISCMVIGEK